MKLNFAICLVLSLSSRRQEALGKTYDLSCQNGVMVIDSFVSRKTKRFRYALLVLRLTLVT